MAVGLSGNISGLHPDRLDPNRYKATVPREYKLELKYNKVYKLIRTIGLSYQLYTILLKVST